MTQKPLAHQNKFHPIHKYIPKGKKVSLLMTGGLDSTYLYWINILNGNTVTPIYTDIQNNNLRSKVELHNVKNIIEKVTELSNKGYTNRLITNQIMVDYKGSVIFQQAPLHLLSIIMNVNQYDTDEVHLGYCMNDDVIGYLDDIKKIYKSYQPIFDIKLPKLSFPLIKVPKEMMLSELPNELKPLIFSCENPTIIGDDLNTATSCGYCIVCKKYKILEDSTHFTRLVKPDKNSTKSTEDICDEIETVLLQKIQEKNKFNS